MVAGPRPQSDSIGTSCRKVTQPMFRTIVNAVKSFSENKSRSGLTLSDPAAAALFFGHGPTASGSSVSPDTALRVPAVYAAIKVIAESIAQLPLVLYRHLPDGGKQPATDHALFDLLGSAPNEWTTSVEWRLAMQSALSAHGNAYSFISRDGSGAVAELIFLHPTQVAVEVDLATSEPIYRVRTVPPINESQTSNLRLAIPGHGVMLYLGVHD
jgi:phage portal protein BeeE